MALIFVESDGTLDAETENWTPLEKSTVESKVRDGIDWWADNPAGPHFNWSLNVSTLQTKYEPIGRPSIDAPMWWIPDVMANIGYFGNDTYSVTDYVNDLRSANNMDWGFVIFVVDSSNDADEMFSDGLFAFALLGGPYMVMTYENDGWGVDEMNLIVAHEMGHIFYATDEYDGTMEHSGYLDAPDDNGADCIMSSSVFKICDSTKWQIGWLDSDGDGIFDIVDIDPTLTLTSPVGNITKQDSVEFTGTSSISPLTNLNPFGTGNSVTVSKVASVKFSVDGGTWQPALPTDDHFDSPTEWFHFTSSVTEGRHTVAIWTNTTYDTSSTYDFGELTVDLTPPVVNISVSNGTVFSSRTANFSMTISDSLTGLDSCFFSLDNGTLESFDAESIQLTNLSDGIHSIEIVVVDKAGNMGKVTRVFRIDTDIFSFTGPYSGLPIYIIIGTIITAVLLTLALFVHRRSKRVSSASAESAVPFGMPQQQPQNSAIASRTMIAQPITDGRIQTSVQTGVPVDQQPAPPTAYCPFCGKLTEWGQFCTHCGGKLT